MTFKRIQDCMRAALGGVLVASMLAPSFAAAEPVLPREWQKLAASFDATLERDRIVGGSIALVEHGRIVAQRNYGYADRAAKRRVDENTLFHWASITKTLNAIAMMQLRDAGRLSLDEPVTRYVPELRRMHNPFGSMDAITIGMLLDHSAGFQAQTWPYRRGTPWEPFEPTQWRQLVAMMPYQEIEFAPGTRFSYSNPAWIYAAQILEQLSADPWAYYIQKNLFAPLGMSRSYFGYTPRHLREHRSGIFIVARNAEGKIETEQRSGEFDPGITIPNGGWNSPLADAAAYMGFLSGGRDARTRARYETVLKRATLEEMWKPRKPLEDMSSMGHMGLAFFLVGEPAAGGLTSVIGHTGSQGGFTSFLYVNPSSGRGVVGALNTGNGAREEGSKSAFTTLREAAVRLLNGS